MIVHLTRIDSHLLWESVDYLITIRDLKPELEKLSRAWTQKLVHDWTQRPEWDWTQRPGWSDGSGGNAFLNDQDQELIRALMACILEEGERAEKHLDLRFWQYYGINFKFDLIHNLLRRMETPPYLT